MLSYAVITICRNAAVTIARTIGSVSRQTPAPTDYVFVDAASQDGTDTIIRDAVAQLSSRGTNITILQQCLTAGSAGIPAAWNQGLAHVDADIVFILNADDWYEPDAARTVLQAFTSRPDVDIVVSPIRYRQTEDGPVERLQRPRPLWLLPLLMPIPHPGCFVRRGVYRRLGTFDERYSVSADYDFVYRAARARCLFHVLDTPIVNMQPGGFARRRLACARRETRDVALRHTRVRAFPYLAYVLRSLTRR